MDSNFRKFLKKILLTDIQKQDAKTKIKGVCKTLHSKYYPDTVYNGSTKFLVGSYGKHTNIRPPKDIDIIFKMPEEEFSRYDSLSENKQSQLLQDVREVLKDTFTTTEEIKAFGKVIVINFSESAHSVELLPAWQLESGLFRIPNTENGGSWDIWDPLAENNNIDKSNVATGKTRSTIRMLKAWVENCSVPLESFVLEILVVDYLSEKHDNEINVLYPELIFGFFDYLKEKKNASIISPASGTSIDIGDEWCSKVESAYSRSEKAIKLEAKNKLKDASLKWKKIFSDDFPITQEKIISETINGLDVKITKLTKIYPSDNEEFLNIKHGIPFRIVPGYRIHIDTEITQKGFRRVWLMDFLEKRIPLLKGIKLNFEIKSINVPSPYEIMWKVRNFGEEAKNAGGLRGEITPDVGYEQKRESTLYRGEHYVECYAIKDGVCVAVGKILVPIGKNYE